MRTNFERWESAFAAYKRAKNPQWRAYWLKVMDYFSAKLN
jgi:hypothetical protein